MSASFMPLDRDQMAWRAARDLVDGSYVNLGLGIPVRVSDFAPSGREVMFHSENGVVGVGPVATGDAIDNDLTDAGSQRITLAPGASLSDSAMAFAMIRGGHIDVTILGGFEVAANGDLANWDTRSATKGPLVGGAMDLVSGARSVRVIMRHVTRDGLPRLVQSCSYPLTGAQVVSRVYTDLAVVDVVASGSGSGFLVREMVEGISREQLQARSGAPLDFASDCAALKVPTLSTPS